jgi:hypothetical protein
VAVTSSPADIQITSEGRAPTTPEWTLTAIGAIINPPKSRDPKMSPYSVSKSNFKSFIDLLLNTKLIGDGEIKQQRK